MTELMFNDFKIYFPSEWCHAVNYWKNCAYELYVQLDDGKTLAFDFIDKTIHVVKPDSKQISDVERINEFGRRLRRLMHAKGLTQNDLSEITGISQATISSYITGRVVPSFIKVDKICRALNCSMDELRDSKKN